MKSRRGAFLHIWPGGNAITHTNTYTALPPQELPVAEQARAASNLPRQLTSAAERLTRQWQIRRREVLDAVSRAIRENRLEGEEALELAQMVHNVAGTAGMFGEGDLGIRASALERALKHGEAAQRSALAEEFLRAA